MQAYGKARNEGIHEIGAVLLSVSSDLLTFDFKETFVNAFDVSLLYARYCTVVKCCCYRQGAAVQVANKAAELLMKGMGGEVCCDK